MNLNRLMDGMDRRFGSEATPDFSVSAGAVHVKQHAGAGQAQEQLRNLQHTELDLLAPLTVHLCCVPQLGVLGCGEAIMTRGGQNKKSEFDRALGVFPFSYD